MRENDVLSDFGAKVAGVIGKDVALLRMICAGQLISLSNSSTTVKEAKLNDTKTCQISAKTKVKVGSYQHHVSQSFPCIIHYTTDI